jgi:hypothetical protein
VIFFVSQMDTTLANAIATIAEDCLHQSLAGVIPIATTVEGIDESIQHILANVDFGTLHILTALHLEEYIDELKNLQGFWSHRAEIWNDNLKADPRFKVEIAQLWGMLWLTDIDTVHKICPYGLKTTIHEVLAYDGFQISADGKWIIGYAVMDDPTAYLNSQHLADGGVVTVDDNGEIEESTVMVEDSTVMAEDEE